MEKAKLGPFGVVEKLKLYFKICGLWPSSGIPSKWLSLLYDVYSLIIHIVFVFLFDLSTCVSVFFLKDVQEATNNLCLTLTLIALYGKVLNFKFFAQQIPTLLHMGEELTLKNDRETLIVDQRMSLFNKLASSFFVNVNVATPFIFIGAMISNEVELPVQGWFPFDWRHNSTIYNVLFIYQFVGLLLQANLNATMDLFTAYLMHLASIKLEILGIRLEMLSKLTNKEELNQQVEYDALVECVVTYQRLWKYTRKLQKCFTYAFFVQICLSGTVVCSIAYQLTNTSPQENVAAYSFLILFQLCMIAQVAIPCYFGNEVILKHDRLTRRIFSCGWHLQSIRYCRIVIIFMETTKKKLSILVGDWFDLDLDLFVSIMYFAYRLYAVLA